MMTWEQIIIQIRTEPKYAPLVDLAYFEADLPLNIERFRSREEYRETLNIIRKNAPDARRILDVGAGNGVASVAFALDGYEVTALEPDPSLTIGVGAIKSLKEHYKLSNLKIEESYGESMPFPDASFDVVYVRQAMHHAADLPRFVKECARVLKPGGLLLTVRDHVIYNEKDKDWFLRSHPLHSFYGGENAFTFDQYSDAIKNAGISISTVLRHYDSVINYFPEDPNQISTRAKEREDLITTNLGKKLPLIGKLQPVKSWYRNRLLQSLGPANDERKIPGRLITFIGRKTA